ncbi:hypothetical protein BDV97DRAFT_354588 [Delphinella strobiligena]|nr:hypothetical protein BDV97DRAFT_354588 [Delphinella strobiligena]
MNDTDQEDGVVPPPSYNDACASGPSHPIKSCQSDLTRPREQSLWTWHKKRIWIRAETPDGRYVTQGSHELATPGQYLHHGIGEQGAVGGHPEVYFTCRMQLHVRTYTTEWFDKHDRKDIRSHCKQVLDALASHREAHKCCCDFEDLSHRTVGSGNYTRISLAPNLKKCRRRWFRGHNLRGWMKLHDDLCACGCFGQIVQR